MKTTLTLAAMLVILALFGCSQTPAGKASEPATGSASNATAAPAAASGVNTPTPPGVTEITWWHSMDGALETWVNDLAKDFNAKNPKYRVIPVYKGEYNEALTIAIAAFRAGKAPDILQVFEVGTATMMAAKGAIKPVGALMKEQGEPFDPKSFIPAVASYYTAPNGQMLSMPFNSSTTVFYYNKDAFKKAGLDPEKAPKTWPEVERAAQKLKAAGDKCPLTTTWMTWVQLESFSTWHNIAYSTYNNGFDNTLATRLLANGPLFVRHFENLEKWNKQGLFQYKGRASKGLASFTSGECDMIMGSSGSYANIKRDSKFAWAISELPYYPDVKGAPQNTIIGGASLWVMSGKSPEEYKGVAKFFEYLSDPKVQSESHKRTGYLPITTEAYKLTEASGFYKDNPGTDVAVNQMVRKVTDKSRGIRIGNYNQVRTIFDEETENIWAGKKSAKQALNDAVQRSNQELAKFEAANK